MAVIVELRACTHLGRSKGELAHIWAEQEAKIHARTLLAFSFVYVMSEPLLSKSKGPRPTGRVSFVSSVKPLSIYTQTWTSVSPK